MVRHGVEQGPALSAAFYERYWQARGRSGYRPRYAVFASWIEQGARVLDVGCGDARLGEELVARGVDYVGCDLAEAAAALGRERGLDVRVGDGLSFLSAQEPGSYDYVVMSEFVEHVVDAEDVLAAAARVAARAVLVSIPNVAYWRHRLELLGGSFPRQWALDPREHLRFWSVRDFERTAAALGLRVAGVRASNGKRVLRDLAPNLFGLQVCFRLEPASATG